MLICELQHVTLNGDHQARLQDVSLQLTAGWTAIVGFSGAGKSSLLSILAGMEQPDSGSLQWFSARPNSVPPAADRGSNAGTDTGTGWQLPLFWAPETAGLWPQLTAQQHLTAVTGETAAGTAGPDSVDKLLRDFDLTERRQAFPEQMSQGEQARLAIARALAAAARVLLLDEPLAHVDPARRPRYWQAIRDYRIQQESALIFATHEPDMVLQQADAVICMDQGRVVYHGPVQVLYDSPADERLAWFLGPVNWFTSDDAQRWLPTSDITSLRPERLQLQSDPTSELEVISNRFSGSFAETRLHHPDGSERTFYHRPAAAVHQAGQRVRIVLPAFAAAGASHE